MASDKDFSNFDKYLRHNMLRNRSAVEAGRVLGSVRPYTNDPQEMRYIYSEDLDPFSDPTLEEYEKMKKEEERRNRGLRIEAPIFVPGKYGLGLGSKKTRKSRCSNRPKSKKSSRKSRKISRKSKKTSRKSRKTSSKSKKTSRKSKKTSRKSRRVSSKSRRVSRNSKKISRKSRKASRKSMRKSRRVSRKKSMGKRERACKDLLKEKVGINLKEYKDGRYVSRQQAIAVAYSQVKKMKPSCGKYFKRKDN